MRGACRRSLRVGRLKMTKNCLQYIEIKNIDCYARRRESGCELQRCSGRSTPSRPALINEHGTSCR